MACVLLLPTFMCFGAPGDEPAVDVPVAAIYADGATAPSDPALRRDPAQYRGRERSSDAGDALAWIPRVAFFPIYAVAEYGVRYPLYKGIEWIDRNHVVPYVAKALHPVSGFYWSPTLSLDLGAITFAGVQARWEDVGVPGHQIKASLAFGGFEAWRAKLQDRWQLGDNGYLGLRGAFETRWDRPFYGLGPYSNDFRTNFTLTRGDGFFFGAVEAGNHFRLQLSAGYRGEKTSSGGVTSVETVFITKDIPAFGEELNLGLTMLDLKLDSRHEVEDNGGVRLLANATYARDFRVFERSFVTAEADLEVAGEVSYPDRVLAARVYAKDTIPIGDMPVPFTHQAILGGENHHGFVWARFRDESAVMAEVRYRYPIAFYVDAQWTASAGNVFSQHFENFDLGALTGSLGAGLRTRRTGMPPIELTFAVGTSRFDERFGLENFRVYLNTTEGL